MRRRTGGADESIRYGTRWVRLVAFAGVSGALLASMAAMVSTNVLAAFVSVNSQAEPARFNSSQIVGQDVAFGMAQANVNGATKSVLRAGFATATLDGFCVSKTENVLGLFNVTIKVTAGNNAPGADISANNASFDLLTLRGSQINLSGKNQVGQATTDVTTTKTGANFDANPLGAPTAGYGKGWVAIDAASGTLTGIKGRLYSAQVQGDITLPNLGISVTGDSGFTCDAPSTTTTN